MSDMINLSEDMRELLNVFRAMSRTEQESVIDYAKFLYQYNRKQNFKVINRDELDRIQPE